MTTQPLRFGLWYDFRNPEPKRQTNTDHYRSIFDDIVWAEELGFRSVWLSEHYFTSDGYTPSSFALAGAIANMTSVMSIGTNVILLPLFDPLRVAADAATLSIVSGGRFELGVGLGYRQLEFDTFGVNIRNRPSLMEEGVEIIRRAWTGRPISFTGKRYSVPAVPVTPVPDVVPPLLMGGLSEAAVERTARIADGYLSGTNEDHQPMYLAALERLGKDPAAGKVYAPQWVIIDEDPERMWAEIGKYAVDQLNEYIDWGAWGPPDDVPRFQEPEEIIAMGRSGIEYAYRLWDADTAVREIVSLVRRRPQVVDVHFWARLPGERSETSRQRIRYIAEQVIPRVHAELAEVAR